MPELGPQFDDVSPIWKKEAREMDAVDARQAASPIHIYEGYDIRNHPNSMYNPSSPNYSIEDDTFNDDYYRNVFAAKNGGYGRHVILGRVMFHNETGTAHIDIHPDVPLAKRGVLAISMLKVADKLHRERTGEGINTNYETSSQGNKLIKGLLPKSAANSIDEKRASAISYLLKEGQTPENNDLDFPDDETKDMFTRMSKNSRNNIKLNPNGKKTWLA
jgi:hypothetical protein